MGRLRVGELRVAVETCDISALTRGHSRRGLAMASRDRVKGGVVVPVDGFHAQR